MWGGEGEGVLRHPEILLSGYTIDSSLDLCTIFFTVKQSKNLGKVTVLQRKKSLSCQLQQIVKK